MEKSNVGINHGFRGRGKVAPYITTHYRIPLPIKPTVEILANKYRELVHLFENPEDPELIAAVIATLTRESPLEIKQETINEVEKTPVLVCPRCDSTLISKDGFQNGKQRYECRDCKRKFINPNPTTT